MLTWEWNFNLGTIVSLIFAAGVFYAITKADLRVLKDNIVEIKATLKQQTETIAQIAVQKAQIENQAAQLAETQKAQRLLDQRVYDLSRGHGFVKEAIQGEWPKD